jgi:hypothetical protein
LDFKKKLAELPMVKKADGYNSKGENKAGKWN